MLSTYYCYCCTTNSTVVATTTTSEYEPLLLLLELLVLQRMRSLVFKVLDSPLLYHGRPTTSLLKKGPGLYQLTPSTAPGLAILDPQQELLLGLDNFGINTTPPFTRHCSISVVRALSKVALCPTYLSPSCGTMVNTPLSSTRTPSHRTTQSPGS